MDARDIIRRDFLKRGAFAAMSSGALFSSGACTANGDAAGSRERAASQVASEGDASWPGVVLQADEGEFLVSGRRRAPMRIKVDSRIAHGATMSMLVSEVAPGAAIPVHHHTHEDEIIFIHTGRGILTFGDERIPGGAGAMLYAPRGVWHGVENTGSETIIWCAIYSPPGLEQYFREVGVSPDRIADAPTPEEALAAATRYGLVFRDP
ncbi:MAG: cupin domain-containing protein [Longimicrobiales bacterium]